MAFRSTDEGMLTEEAASIGGTLGNSLALWPVSLNLPLSLEISIEKLRASIEKVSGNSGKFFSVSIKSLAGIQIFPSSFASTSMVVTIVVSRSEAETVSCFLLISNRKLSRMGSVLLEFKTPLMD